MLFDAGIINFYKLADTAEPGDMPQPKLISNKYAFYGERTVGFSRQYAAMSVNEQVDMLVRIWYDNSIKIGMYAVPEDGEQYRITNVQHLTDEEGLKVTDVTLTRLEQNFELNNKN